MWSEKRIEKKIVFRPEEKFFLEDSLFSGFGAWETVFKPRKIHNIYFDTLDFENFRNHREGHSPRSKWRVRWYGEDFQNFSQPSLEIKKKSAGISEKWRWSLKGFRVENVFSTLSREAWIKNCDLPSEIQWKWMEQWPSLINSYERHYYQTADGSLRLTVDKNLSFSDSVLAHEKSPQSRLEIQIVELKIPLEMSQKLDEIFRSWPFRLEKNSKYILGKLCLEGANLPL